MLPAKAKGPVPAVMVLNYLGNHTILNDPQVTLTPNWLYSRNLKIGGASEYAGEETRGYFEKISGDSAFPAAFLVSRGYALVTAAYGDFFVDHRSSADKEYRALATWGWALMRGMDMVEEKVPEIDNRRVVVTGCSRVGKAALIAGAYDERFSVVVPNQTGGGGAPLAKHYYGENIASETATFPHWYSKEYAKYANKEAELPFDQHMLLACVAPRALLIQGFADPWFDTKGEFLSVAAAQSAWQMFGLGGIGVDKMPADYETSAIGEHVGYVRRDLGHGISMTDWVWMLDFADKQWR